MTLTSTARRCMGTSQPQINSASPKTAQITNQIQRFIMNSRNRNTLNRNSHEGKPAFRIASRSPHGSLTLQHELLFNSWQGRNWTTQSPSAFNVNDGRVARDSGGDSRQSGCSARE